MVDIMGVIPKSRKMSDLKPCPFCGGEAKTENLYVDEYDMTVIGKVVECCDCKKVSTFSHATNAEEDAIKQWNNRPNEDNLQADVKTAQGLVESSINSYNKQLDKNDKLQASNDALIAERTGYAKTHRENVNGLIKERQQLQADVKELVEFVEEADKLAESWIRHNVMGSPVFNCGVAIQNKINLINTLQKHKAKENDK